MKGLRWRFLEETRMARKSTTRSLGSQLKGFDQFVARAMKNWNVPGLAIGIVKDGQTVYAKGHGLKHVRRRLPVTAHTSFAIGSCTKAFTTTAMGILVDEGKLDWDKPVREYMPSFKMHDPVATEQMTPRDLVAHRSGLPRHDMVWEGTPCDRDALFHRLRYLEPSKSFRSVYQYNNLMFMAAGVLLEHLAGCAWETFVQQRLLDPLGITSVTFSAADMAGLDDFSLGYDRRGKRIVHVPHENIVPVGPAGSMNAHIIDMCRWVAFQMNLGKVGRKRIISEKSLKVIHTPQMVFQEEPVYEELLDPAYAMGWSVQPYRGHRRLVHSGCVDGFNASASFMPTASIGVVVLTNVTASPLIRLIPYNVFDRLLGLEPIDWNARFRKEERDKKAAAARRSTGRRRGPRPTHPLRDYVGEYEHPGYGKLTVTLDKRKLRAVHNGFTRPLVHVHYDQFEMVSRGVWPWRKTVTFNIDLKGRISSLSAALQDGASDIVFNRMEHGDQTKP